jgi:hypothetical protein
MKVILTKQYSHNSYLIPIPSPVQERGDSEKTYLNLSWIGEGSRRAGEVLNV